MLKVKPKKCRQCGNVFTPKFRTTETVCSVNCGIAFGMARNAKEEAKKAKTEAKEWAKEKKERKEAIMTHSEWLKILQVTFNTFIRTRDAEENCISCQRPLKGRKFDAGHFRSVGGNPQLRFNEENCFGQCVPCNRDKHGHLLEYRKKLVIKLGLEKVEWLENFNESSKLSITEIKEKIQYYKQKIKQLKNGSKLNL